MSCHEINSKMEWRSIPGFEDYEISNQGDIRRLRDGYITKCTLSENRWCLGLKKENRWISCRRYRLLALAWIPNPNDYTEVDHIDRDCSNDSLENLRWVSASENLKNRNTYSNTGHKFIVKRKIDGRYSLQTPYFRSTYKTLEQAIAVRDTIDIS